MSANTAPRTGLSIKQILSPVAHDVERIDGILRSLATLDFPLLNQGIEALIAAGGKRLRPAVLFMAARFNHYDIEKLLPMAAAIELLHTASLVHDDTIDHALIRRGLPTLNSLVDQGTTVLVGDFLFAKSAVLSTMPGVPRATRIFAESLVTICEGEIEQKFSSHHVSTSLERYYKRIYSKTAVLFAAAGEIGGVLSGAPEDDIQSLRLYGKHVGMAFQVVDDILDVKASSEELGKPTSGDLRQGTVTLPTILYLERADEEGRSVIQRAIEGDVSEGLLQDAAARIASSGALQHAADIARQFVVQAQADLGGFPDNENRRSLLDLADFAVQRSF